MISYVATQPLSWFTDQVQEQDQSWVIHYYDWDTREAKTRPFSEVYFAKGYFWTKGCGLEDMRWGQGYVGVISREIPDEEDGYRIVAHNRRAHR